jgi:hypothetical protein
MVRGKPNSLHNIVVSNAYNSLTAFKYANSQKFPRIVVEKRGYVEKPLRMGLSRSIGMHL